MQNSVVAYFCTKIFSLSLEILCGFLKNILKTLLLAVYLYAPSLNNLKIAFIFQYDTIT